MASIINRPNKHRWIQFVSPSGKRCTVRLGQVTAKTAAMVCRRIEELLALRIAGDTMSLELATWLNSVDDGLRNKLAAVGLCEPRMSATLSAFIDRYVHERTDVKPATKEVWRQGATGLIEFFGPNKSVRDVTPGEADGYKLHLIGKGLAPMTVRKRLQFATMIFRAALRRRLISENPFTDVSIKAVMPNRDRFITLDETARLLDACPNHHWRAIVALARYGGLRCPSEVLSLRWMDIDWAAGRIVVTSPKTEHHPGKASRTIPLFPELRSVLEECFELAAEGAVYVVDERMRARARGKAGWRNCNLRTTFMKIVRRAGLTPWPRLFHNLRASRQTELAERFPAHVVCDWLGNSEAIARKHYFQTTEEHFARALQGEAKPEAQAKQNPKQHATAGDRNKPKAASEVVNTKENMLCGASRNLLLHKDLTDGEGFEPPVPERVQQFSRLPP